ncbi:MlaD family protein [Amycolatopsis methanolica]|uniref:Mammalian cell entry related domain protein n=1 Tax=Amycolatopsis methanolica 239 TaxID=1068978 RepID=A0A076MQZ1_AMYME|nr:MlaD family protein [Amycolatopsis methanolica]AIJ23303.1 Mammalian cell entry related domain protein [Amycolatopsis methanolica 239]
MRSRLVRTIATVAVVATVAATGAALWSGGDDDQATVVAMFADASPLIPGNTVNLRGMKIGEITDIALERGQARVVMSVDPGVLPLHSDARATVRPVSLLGERYVELDPGSPSAPVLPGDAVITADRTSAAVDLDQVLNSLDDPTSTALAALVTTLGEGTGGRAGDIDAALKALQPAMTRTGELGALLDDQNAVLTQLLDRVRPVADALAAGQGRNLDQLVQSFTATLATVSQNREALRETLAELPGFLDHARAAVREIAGVTQQMTPVLADIRPVTDDLTAITRELTAFADTADPALAAARPVLDHAKALLDQAAPLVKALQPQMADLRSGAEAAVPLGRELADNLDGLLAMITGWGLACTGYDSVSHYFRGMLVATPSPLLQTVQSELLGSPGGGKSAPETPDAPAPQAVPVLTDPLTATGLSQEQEKSLIGQLLGGGR